MTGSIEGPSGLWNRGWRLGPLFPVFTAVLILVFSSRRSPDVTTGELAIAAAVLAALMLVSYTVILADPVIPAPCFWLAGFTLACLINFPVALVQGVPVIEWARHALPVICLPGFAWGGWLLNARAARALYWVIAGLCGVITVYYLSFWFSNPSFAAVHAGYGVAFWTAAGGVFASVIAACLLFPFAMRTGRRWSVAAFVAGCAGIAATFSRTFWIMAPAALAVTAIFMNRRGMLKASRLFLLGVLTSILAAAVGGILLLALSTRVDTAGLSGTQRIYESQAILSTMRSDPRTFVAGAGFGARYREAAIDTTALSDGLGTDTRDFSHDFPLQVLWNTGIIGLGAYLAALISWLRITGRSRNPYAMGCFAAVLAISLGSFTYPPFGDLGWDVLTGLLLGLGCRLARERPEDRGVTAALVMRQALADGLDGEVGVSIEDVHADHLQVVDVGVGSPAT